MHRSILSIFSLFALFACTENSPADLTETIDFDSVSYNGNVKSIIDNNCISCHGSTPTNGAPMSLTTYENVKEAVQNRGLIDRISRNETETGHMPLGGPRLPQNLIDLIVQWQIAEFPQ